jgi:hypothetical protein
MFEMVSRGKLPRLRRVFVSIFQGLEAGARPSEMAIVKVRFTGLPAMLLLFVVPCRAPA